MKPSLALALLFTATLSAQTEIWVEPVNGNDANPGTYTQPLRTLSAAVGLALAGDHIYLLPGTYGPGFNGETLPIQIGQNPQPDLVIRGIGDVVFDLGASTSTFLYLAGLADGLRITNIEVTNTDQSSTNWWVRVINSGSGVNSQNAADDVEIDRCRFVDVNRVFVLWTDDNVTGWKVHDNLFVNCTNDAILEYTGTNEFYNNTFYTGSFKAYISDSATSTFYDNLIVDYSIALENNNAAALLNRYQGNWIFNCATVQQGPGMGGALPATNTVGVDPQLVNPTGRDFHLQASSPLIDAGVPPPYAEADLDSNSRLVDGDLDGMLEVDIGCYEVTPIHLAATWDALNMLLWLDGTTTLPGTYGFVAFSLDEGLTQIPGQGPILLDQNLFIPVFLQGPLPQQWALPFPGVLLPPGTRLVMQILGIGPNHVGKAVFLGNQAWHQF